MIRRVVLPLLVSVATAAPVGAAAQPSVGVRLIVASMTGVVGPGVASDVPRDDVSVRLLVENLGSGTADDLTVLVEVFAATGSRSALHAAVDDGEPVDLLEDVRADVAPPIPAGEVAALVVEVPGDLVGWDGSGVHPVRISLLRGRTVLDEVDTAVVRLERPPTERIATFVGWPIDAAPGNARRLAHVGGRLDSITRAVEATSGIATPLVGPHALEDLAAATDTGLLERIRRLAASGAVAGVYADADLAGLVRHGLASEAIQQVTEGHRQAERRLGVPLPADALWVGASSLSPTALAQALVPARIRSVVLPWDLLRGGDAERPTQTPPSVRSLRAGGTEIVAAVGDPWFSDLLADLPDEHGAAVAVQRIVAETAMLHLERPNAAGRGLVVLPPAAWDPHPRVARELLRQLPRLPWIAITDLTGLVTAVPERPLGFLAESEDRIVDATLAERIRDLRARLSSLQAALAEPANDIGGRSWDDLDERILRASSTWPIPRDDRLDEVESSIAIGFGRVTLPDRAVVTLTDPEGAVPITLTRAEGGPVQVAVTLEAPPRLIFPEGSSRVVTLASDRTATISFAIEARGSGRIPVTVRVTDPSGTVEIARSTFVVRSTALSAPALAVLGSVLALLVLWWIVRRVRPPRPQLRVVRDEAA